jgi:hypothetical protein
MRTVLVHLRDATELEVKDYLVRAYPLQPDPPWVCATSGDPVLYVDFYRDIEWEFSAALRDALRRELGCDPATSVAVDVSGRHSGDEEVRCFVNSILARFAGVAQDEYTDHIWTKEQIRMGHRVQGHTFFDYRGWYEQHREI